MSLMTTDFFINALYLSPENILDGVPILTETRKNSRLEKTESSHREKSCNTGK